MTKHTIILNSVRCKHCGDTITSTHRHDFKYCKCGKVFVDGGTDYLRRGFETNPQADYEELSEFSDDNDQSAVDTGTGSRA